MRKNSLSVAIVLSLAMITFSTYVFGEAGPLAPQPPVVAAPSPVAMPAPVVAPPASAPTVAVAEPAPPPQWAQDLVVRAESLPVVGPYIAKVFVYGSILTALLSLFIAFLLGVLKVLSGVFNAAGLANYASKIAAFRDGKFMYWLMYISHFNAKNPDPGK